MNTISIVTEDLYGIHSKDEKTSKEQKLKAAFMNRQKISSILKEIKSKKKKKLIGKKLFDVDSFEEVSEILKTNFPKLNRYNPSLLKKDMRKNQFNTLNFKQLEPWKEDKNYQ